MIRLTHVSKIYGSKKAVDDLSFTVNTGENFILLGTSGCGKTTTLKMINRLIAASEGEIVVNEKNITAQSPEQLRRGIGYVLQRNSLFPHYTVYENMAVVPGLLNWDNEKTSARINTLIQKLHLSEDHLTKYPHQLSGGEAQRVNLARALVADPPILLMDEPFSALDTITRNAIRNEFTELDELKKKTIVMVTHDVQEAFEMGDRICLMDQGKIMQIGSPADLLFKPANDFVREFLSGAFMQLALSITTVKELWSYLDDEKPNNTNTYINISADSTLFKAIESIKNKNDDTLKLQVTSGEDNSTKKISWQGLLSAFSNYQRNK